jgi:hypothetical protein
MVRKVTVGAQAMIEALSVDAYGMITTIYSFWTGTTGGVMCDKASNSDLCYSTTTPLILSSLFLEIAYIHTKPFLILDL